MRKLMEREESLEAVEERARRSAGHRDDDEEAALQELVDVFVPHREPSPTDQIPRGVKRNEFVCDSCHLVIPRSRLADHDRRICRDCVRAADAAGVRQDA